MKIFKVLLILALGLQIGFAEGESGSENNDNDVFADYNYYLKYESKSIVNDGECWVCDEVKDGFVAIKESVDTTTGTTYCKVYKTTDISDGAHIGFANRQVKSCAYQNSKTAKEVENYSKTITSKSTNQKEITSSLVEKSNNKKITFSKFMVGLLTLNPNIINRKNSVLGEIQSNQELAANSYDYEIGQGKDILAETIGSNKRLEETGSVNYNYKAEGSTFKVDGNVFTIKTDNLDILDSFNKKNMGYFNNLFGAMEKIYQHLQIFIFILIGGFFVMTIGASKIQAYLENRGESEGKQPYLHKFYIPLLMVGVFFMPIPEGNGYHSTVMQNMIRYFAQYSTTIADMANTVGEKVYLDKIYSSIGNVSERELKTLETQMGEQLYKTKVLGDQFGEHICCFTDKISTKSYNDFDRTKESVSRHCVQKNNIKNCAYASQIEKNYSLEADRANKLANDYALINHFQNGYTASLNNIDKYFLARNQGLGWFDAAITPTASFFVESYLISQASNGAVPDKTMEQSLREINTKKMQIDRFSKVNNISKEEAEQKLNNKFNSANESLVGDIAGRLVWMMFPGANSVKNFIYDPSDGGSGVLKEMHGFVSTFFSKIPMIGSMFSKVGNWIPVGSVMNSGFTLASYYITTILMEWTFALIPLMVISVASIVAIASYMVTLCKYFYISPFVTAWAMATKRVDKIIDFLLAGIAIFFKPVLIVLFIYLSLFLYSIVNDFFIYVALEQFSGILFPESDYSVINDVIMRQNAALDSMKQASGVGDWTMGLLNFGFGSIAPYFTSAGKMLHNFHLMFILGAISGLIKIFGSLAGSYVAWKLIVSGPGWALGMIGLDGKQDDMIAQGIESNLSRRAFVA